MGRISSSLNLAAFKNAVVIKHGKNKDVECLLIPLEQNHLSKTDKGAVYFETVGFPFENKSEKSKSTHIVKQSFSKETLEKFSEDEKKELPIFGNHVDWDARSGGSTHAEASAPSVDDIDDLPF